MMKRGARLEREAVIRGSIIVALLCLALPALSRAANKVALPEWENKSAGEGYTLGGGLWPGGAASEAGENLTAADIAAGSGASGSNTGTPGSPPPLVSGPARAEDLIAVSRGGGGGTTLRPVVGLRVPAPMLMPLRIEEVFSHELPPVEGELRDEYFSLRPVEHLVDPQQLLTEQKSHDIQRFLEYHADEAEFDICLLLFGGSQEIPSDISLEQKHREWFGDEPVVTVAFFLKHPERTQVVYGEKVRESLPGAVFDRIFQSCVREAQVAETAFDQVERLIIELSVRVYYLSKLLERQSAGEVIPSTEEELSEPKWRGNFANAEEGMTDLATAGFVGKLGDLPWVWLGLGGAVLISLLSVGGWWWRRDSLAAKPVLFPDLEVPSRLGGVYSGGGYVGISFDVAGSNDL